MTHTNSPAPTRPAADTTTSGSGRLAPARVRLLTGLAFAVGAGLIALAVSLDTAHPVFQGWDNRWLAWMGGPHTGFPHAVAMALNWFGAPTGVVVPLALALLLAALRRWWSLLFFATAYLGGSVVVVQVLKNTVDRQRPAHPLVTVDHGSFPSGHAFGAALLVVLVGALFVPVARRGWWWLFSGLFVLTMMWSRTWLHAHWLSDTVAGALAGAATALLLWRAFTPLLSREADRRQLRRR
ncbi:phosphatase PAP2 family protein [Streptacidiphilus jiangxiensis]|uniref:Undecaprenyl-diphosphatase n=1 Tax=Streptacidiphilus jiangxiensis TaxID=235985 RepID=A0A1H7P3F1_STRJI|nr:phosphatase PAP2 family protein [Streptacidiphilus jiangxiensis]SEL30119.1 undecaprenyl-diphosphatase [Streptacidiphilus jiangxiensis]